MEAGLAHLAYCFPNYNYCTFISDKRAGLVNKISLILV